MNSACERGAVVGESRSSSNGGVGGSAFTIIAASEAASTPSDGVEDGVDDGVEETEAMSVVTGSRGKKRSSAKSAAGRRKNHDATPHHGTKRKKQEHGKFHLESPDFEIPDFGGGVRRNRYPTKFKLDAVAYSEKIVEGGRGPGGSIGISYATKRLGIRDCSSIVRWKQDRRNLEAELLPVVEVKKRVVTNRKKKEGKVASNRKRPRAAHVKVEADLFDCINELRSENMSPRLTTHILLTFLGLLSQTKTNPSDAVIVPIEKVTWDHDEKSDSVYFFFNSIF